MLKLQFCFRRKRNFYYKSKLCALLQRILERTRSRKVSISHTKCDGIFEHIN